MWPIVFLVSGLVTHLLIGLAVNTGNVSGSGAANAAGMTYLWMISVAGWVIFSSNIRTLDNIATVCGWSHRDGGLAGRRTFGGR